MESFIQRHADKIIGWVSGWDRLRFRGTIRGLAHVTGLDRFLGHTRRLLKDFGEHALALSRQTREASLGVAEAAGRPVVHLSDPGVSKEDVARQIQARDGIQEGLICVLTAVEPCWSFKVRYRQETGRLELVRAYRKCQHVYHYQVHPEFGFMHVRLQTWLPFSQWVCVNGREWLGRQMDREKIAYLRRENCFAWIAQVARAQELLEQQVRWNWTKTLNEVGAAAHPALPRIADWYELGYYWSLDESEWATDLMFREPAELARCYPHWIRHGIESFRSRDVLRFLGHRVRPDGGVHGNLKAEVVSDLKERPEGMRIKHRVGENSIKMYDKQASVLRVETTLNNMRQLMSPRIRDGKVVWRRMRKGVADIARRAEVSEGCNRRYLQALAAVESRVPLGTLTEGLGRPVVRDGRRSRGLNLLGAEDGRLLELVGHGEFLLHGFRNRDLRAAWFQTPADSQAERRRRSGQMSRKLALLRAHGLIAKVSGTHRYLVTDKGRQVISALHAARAADIATLTRAA